MSNGFYIAAQAMKGQQKRLNASANNIANVKTNGYKKENVILHSFEEQLRLRVDGRGSQVIGKTNYLQAVDVMNINFDLGNLEQTQSAFDVCIAGDGFFLVQTRNGQSYTRDGSFSMDDEGYLIIEGKGRILGEAGPIKVDNDQFRIDEQGNVYNRSDAFVGKLQVRVPDDMNQMKKGSNGFFTYTGTTPLNFSNAAILQGVIERSNVDMNEEMTQMIEIQRNFQSVSSTLKQIDQINAKAVSEIGKV